MARKMVAYSQCAECEALRLERVRNADALCLSCDQGFCGTHIAGHLADKHQVYVGELDMTKRARSKGRK